MTKTVNYSRYLLSALVGVVAATFYQYLVVLGRWRYIDDLPRENFNLANFKVRKIDEIKTTYYSTGHLGDVLKEWPHSEFHLFRVKEGDAFEFDGSILDSNTSARILDYDCTGVQESDCTHKSVLVPNCIFELNSTVGEEAIINAKIMLTEEGKGYHVSFANLTNRDSIKHMWNSLNLPDSFSLDQTNFEHAFISNLKSDQITACFHANPITDSMAVQLVGKKTWLFLPSETYLSLMKSTFAGSALFPKQAPPPGSNPEVYVITTQPGDVLFFPESWGHAVYTYEGPNLLMNYRKVHPGNFLRQPLTWAFSLAEHLINGREFTNKMQTMQYVPTKKLNVKVSDIYADMCATGGRTGFDKQMLEIIEEEAKNVNNA